MKEKSIKKTLISKTDWAKLRQMKDSEIDYSDIPPTNKAFWADAEKFMPKHKTQVSMRLDDEVIDFFKKEGRGYQSKINAVLKTYVHSHAKQHKQA